MTSGKESWKKTGKELGGAFGNLGKSIVRSAMVGANKVGKWAESSNEDEETKAGAGSASNEENTESNVFNDGTWRKTGKGLGHAFADLGGSIMNSVENGAEKTADLMGNLKSKTTGDGHAEDGKDAVAEAEVVSEEKID